MDTSKILNADLLDIVFDNRNKDYGAYELRKNYQGRITKALVFTCIFVLLTFAGVVMFNKLIPKEKSSFLIRELTLESIKSDEKKPEPIPEPPRRVKLPQIQAIQHTQYVIVDDNKVIEPPPRQEDFVNSIIDTKSIEGDDYDGTIPFKKIDEEKGIIEDKTTIEPQGPLVTVEVQAKCDCNWENFLLRNLNAEIPVDNGAPEGSYTVFIQFVIDIDGSISDIKPLTSHGFGLEEEAVRVIRKATKWEPAIQNGHPVKAYRKQPITFRVLEE